MTHQIKHQSLPWDLFPLKNALTSKSYLIQAQRPGVCSSKSEILHYGKILFYDRNKYSLLNYITEATCLGRHFQLPNFQYYQGINYELHSPWLTLSILGKIMSLYVGDFNRSWKSKWQVTVHYLPKGTVCTWSPTLRVFGQNKEHRRVNAHMGMIAQRSSAKCLRARAMTLCGWQRFKKKAQED